MREKDGYVPALRYRWLTKFYDPIIAVTTREKTFKNKLIEIVDIGPGDKVLDIGCGTGTLAIRTKMVEPDANITGIDGDPEVLELAKRKARDENLEIGFDQGLSFSLPYQDDHFDRCLSSLFFHHLTIENKLITFREIYRVLKTGGQCHIADWGKPANPLMRLLFYQIQLLDGFTTTRDNVEGRIPSLMQAAHFSDVREVAQFSTMFGTMTLYNACKS